MEYKMGGHSKLCATCEYWIGPREPNYYGNMVVIENQSAKGRCWCLNGPYPRADRLNNITACSRYQKWAVLR